MRRALTDEQVEAIRNDTRPQREIARDYGVTQSLIWRMKRRGYTSPPTMEERFWSKVDKSGGPDACWDWTGTRHPETGYGAFWVPQDGLMRQAHRVAFALATGEVDFKAKDGPKGDDLVLHFCDRAQCTNPRHLYRGTQKQNVADCEGRGRSIHLRGEEHGQAKLTSEQVEQIRHMRAAGASDVKIAAVHDISTSTVSNVCSGKTWASVGGPRLRGTNRGSRNGNAKLTDECVRGIRFRDANLSGVAVAEKYSVSRALVCRIRQGKAWAHIKEAA